MTFLDIVVIYLACGAPFAVHQMTRTESAVSWQILSATATLLLWPFFAAKYLFTLFRSPKISGSNVESFRTAIEAAGVANGQVGPLFEFRNVFYRYTGLLEALSHRPPDIQTHALYDVVSHSAKDLASVCLLHQNKRKLTFHFARAQKEFTGILSEFDLGASSRLSVATLMAELCDHLDDFETSVKIRSVISSISDGDGAAITDKARAKHAVAVNTDINY